jgi:SAM-dependent methyltransferase
VAGSGKGPTTAAERWAAALGGWAIPDHILAQAPESPWGFPPALFGVQDATDSALHRLARARLAAPGRVLDVGCGGGAASVPLAPKASILIGVDTSPEMLAAFARAATEAGVGHQEVRGDWPGVAAEAPVADVVVCRNVVYNVADIAPFVAALSAHATRRVVVELTDRHPSVAFAPLWREFWGLDRPDGPSADLFAEVLGDLGIHPVIESEVRPAQKATHADPDYVAFVRRRLCLPDSRDSDIAAALSAANQPSITAVAVAWDLS